MKPFITFKKNFRRIYFVALLVLATLSFCVGCEKKPPLKIGDNAPVISGNDIHGEPVGLDRFKGKIVVIFFWTNSCCGDKLKLLEPLFRQYKDKGLAILAVNEGNSKEEVETYTKTNDLTFVMQTDEYAITSKRYGIIGFPTIFILDKNGIIRKKILGDIQTEQLQKLILQQSTIQKEIEANYEKSRSR